MSAPGNQKSAQPGLKTAREYALIEGFARLIGNLNQSRLPLPVDGVVQSILNKLLKNVMRVAKIRRKGARNRSLQIYR